MLVLGAGVLFGIEKRKISTPQGSDVKITIEGANGGGSNYLNTIKKTKDEGTLDSSNSNKIEYYIDHSYSISTNSDNSLNLVVNLVYRKPGKNDLTWQKTIKIATDKELKYSPFKGIVLRVITIKPRMK